MTETALEEGMLAKKVTAAKARQRPLTAFPRGPVIFFFFGC